MNTSPGFIVLAAGLLLAISALQSHGLVSASQALGGMQSSGHGAEATGAEAVASIDQITSFATRCAELAGLAGDQD